MSRILQVVMVGSALLAATAAATLAGYLHVGQPANPDHIARAAATAAMFALGTVVLVATERKPAGEVAH